MNVDLHCHRAEAKNTLVEFLEECLQKHIRTISITDHRTLKTYMEEFPMLTEEQQERYKDIRIIVGIEMTGVFQFINIAGQKSKIPMDVLGYNMDLRKVVELNEKVKKNYVDNSSREYQEKQLQKLIAVAKSLGFQADYEDMKITEEEPFAGRIMGYKLADPKYIDANIQKGLIQELKITPGAFFNRYCKNAASPFYLDMSDIFPDVKTVFDIIHSCGGKVALPHTAGYFPKAGSENEIQQAWEDSKKFVKDVLEKYPNEIQGIEVIHPCFLLNPDIETFLIETATEHSLFTTGGTDWHQPGQRLGEDIHDNPITEQRVPNIDEWARFYSVKEIVQVAQEVKKEAEKKGGERE